MNLEIRICRQSSNGDSRKVPKNGLPCYHVNDNISLQNIFKSNFHSFTNLLAPGGGSVQRQGLYLHRTTQHRETQTHSHAASRFEPAIPMFERPKTVLALDRAAIETGKL
jgi:hypothetical protein